MDDILKGKKILGINGVGRIGKLTLWNHLNLKHFDSFVLNAGRKVGKKFEDMVNYLLTDSTYGTLDSFLFGYSGQKCEIKIVDEGKGLFTINGTEIKVLSTARNPREINWVKEGVKIVIDCTGAFLDPTIPADSPKGSLRGHIEAGAEKVIISAPFKIKDKSLNTPEDSGMFVYGVNHTKYNPDRHHIISAASCTTTGLAHMVKPLLENELTNEILTASMSTVHAATNNQNILDAVPGADKSDLRRNRSTFNNIIPTTTGAAIALEEILPEIKKVGFMADSVRIPTNTSSLIALNLTFKTKLDNETKEPEINRKYLNDIYKNASEGAQKDMLVFSEKQNVSSDIIGYQAAVVIEGVETHTRTGFIPIQAETLKEYGIECQLDINIPVTHAKIFGWYDNEFGSYVNFLSKLVIYVDKNLN